MLAHNGGFTEMVPNTSVISGVSLVFSFAPLWSADQGVVCRYGSMDQYGAMCCFLGEDQPYQLSPSGLQPFGSKVASLLQGLSYWTDGNAFTGGLFGTNSGLFGSIVEMEGEKHYLLAFAANPTASTGRFTQVFDCNIAHDAWSQYTFEGITLTTKIYQALDFQVVTALSSVVNDNWLLVGYETGPFNGSVTGFLENMIIGQNLFTETVTPLFTTGFSILFRAEAPTINIPQTTRRLIIEYENLAVPNVNIATVVQCTLFGQPKQGGYPNAGQVPLSNVFDITLQYYAPASTVPQNAVLTAYSEPLGTSITTLATTLQLVTNQPIRVIRAAIIAETTQGDIQ